MRPPFFFFALSLLFTYVSLAGDPIIDAVRGNFSDVPETKARAEAGDPAAQLPYANILANAGRTAEALLWYRKAAQRGNIEAVYSIGNILTRGAGGITPNQGVKADPVSGVQYIFWAATNRHRVAYYDLYKAHRDGTGVVKDLVQAYAWLQLDILTTPAGFITPLTRQPELNRLALDVDVATAQAGRRLAARYNAGQWPTLKLLPPASPPSPAPVLGSTRVQLTPAAIPPPPAPRLDPGLKLNGIALGKTPLAIINGKSLAEGQTITLPLKPKPLAVKCLQIETNSVLVNLEGEDTPRRLYRN